MNAHYENRDGSAIIAAAKRIRSKTQNQGVFIIISDGEPSAVNYRGEAAENHTRRMANEVEKMGFQVIQVTIGGYRSKNMFKNVIEMNDMSTFPQEFTAFLRTKINTLIKEKVTM
jgi:nitric oxide reductase activation protein